MDSLNNHQCGVANTIRVIGSKWSMLILHNIFEGKTRFGQLQKELSSISPKTLSLRLKELEKEKLVQRKILAEVPLHVEYSLTPKGKSLQKIFDDMASWGSNNS